LTNLAERSLYSAKDPSEKEAAKAEDYSKSLLGQLEDENR